MRPGTWPAVPLAVMLSDPLRAAARLARSWRAVRAHDRELAAQTAAAVEAAYLAGSTPTQIIQSTHLPRRTIYRMLEGLTDMANDPRPLNKNQRRAAIEASKLDMWSSASRQHYIDTGDYLPAEPRDQDDTE